MQINNESGMFKYFTEQHPNEGCGVIVDNTFLPTVNSSNNPTEDFEIPGREYIKHAAGIQAIVHSHTKNEELYDNRCPSMSDMQGQLDTGVPWGITYTNGSYCSPLLWFGCHPPRENLVGRPYVHSVYDCYTVVKDWFEINHNIRLSTYPRSVEAFENDRRLLEKNFPQEGFEVVNAGINDLQRGDVLMIKLFSRNVNHVAVVNSETTVIEHLLNRFSSEQQITQLWDRTAYVVRHKELM